MRLNRWAWRYKGKMILIFAHNHIRQQSCPQQALLNGLGRERRQDHFILAGATGIFGPSMLDHMHMRQRAIYLFVRRYADLTQKPATPLTYTINSGEFVVLNLAG